jgi:type IV pilus assembly protein PilX
MLIVPNRPGRFCPPQHQRGATLVVGMILMVLLTLLGLTALGTSLLEERMAANARDRIRAFQAAEAALRFCEAAITPASTFSNTGGSGGMYTPSVPPRWETVNWSSDAAVLSYAGGIPLVDSQPRCIAEQLDAEINLTPGAAESLRIGLPVETERTYRHYRVTARGVGVSDRTVVMLQSHLRVSGD